MYQNILYFLRCPNYREHEKFTTTYVCKNFLLQLHKHFWLLTLNVLKLQINSDGLSTRSDEFFEDSLLRSANTRDVSLSSVTELMLSKKDWISSADLFNFSWNKNIFCEI